MRKDDIQLSSLPCYNKRMKYEIIRTETMRLVGFAARTNNGAPDCGAVIVGSATHNNNVLPGIADVLTYMKGLRPLNRVGAAFGSYGWSGESPKIIQEWLASMNMDMPADPVKCLFVPKHEGLSQCVALGKTVAEALKAKC